MLGSSDVATIAILADVITIDFNPANYTVNEGENVTLRVLLTGDTPTSDINIDIRSNDGTAIGNVITEDYSFKFTQYYIIIYTQLPMTMNSLTLPLHYLLGTLKQHLPFKLLMTFSWRVLKGSL